MIPHDFYMVVHRVKATQRRPASEWRFANIPPTPDRDEAVGAAQNRIAMPYWADTEYAVVRYAVVRYAVLSEDDEEEPKLEIELEIVGARPRVTNAAAVMHKRGCRWEDDEDEEDD